jgi:hypothetical protein
LKEEKKGGREGGREEGRKERKEKESAVFRILRLCFTREMSSH